MAFGNTASADNIEIRVVVDNTGAVKILGDTEKAIQKTGKAAEVATGGFTKFQAGIVSMQAGLGLARDGFNLLSISTQKAFAAIERGSTVDDMTSAFENFSKQANVSADVLLNQLNTATGRTISDFTLMEAANRNMLAGLDPTRFEETARATRALAEATGVDLTQALNVVDEALIRGNDRGLKQLQVNVDLDRAYRKAADALGVEAAQLSENQKILVARDAMIAALLEKEQKVAPVVDDTADAIARMRKSIKDNINETLRKIATDQVMLESLDGLATSLNNIDWGRYIKGIGAATLATIGFAERVIMTTAATIENFQNFANDPSLKTAFSDVLRDQVPEFRKQLGEVNELLQKGTPEAIKTAQAQFVDLVADIQTSQVATIALSKEINDLGAKVMPQTAQATTKTGSTAADLKKRYDELLKSLEASRGEMGESTKGASELADKLKKIAELNSIKGIADFSKQLRQIGVDGATAGASTDQLDKETKDLLETYKKLGGTGTSALQAIDAAIRANQEALEENAAKLDELDKKKGDGGLAETLFGDAESNEKAVEDIGREFGLMLLDGLSSGISDGLNGESLRPAFDELFEESGALGGKALGTAYGGPIGGAIGEAIGRHLGDKIGDVISSFGEDSAGTQGKKALDQFFADLFKDLQFSGNQNPLTGAFSEMAAGTQAAYTVVGDSITSALGIGTDLGINLGVVLANNNVQLGELSMLLGEAGLSFEQLGSEMYEAFYDGELSALDLQNRLEELYGIIDGSSVFPDLGAAVQAAFDSDGRQLLSAIKAIGKEAEQLGITTLPQMADILVNRFGIAAEKVKQIMASMTTAGINSVADLANASQSTLTATAANIEQAKAGIAPDNFAVIKAASTAPRSGSKGGGMSAAEKKKKEAEAKEAKLKQQFLALIGKVQNSGAGKDLDKQVISGIINDGEYVTKLQDITTRATAAQKVLDNAEKKYANSRKKGAKEQNKALKALVDAQNELENILGGSTKGKGFEVNGGFVAFAQQFAGNIDLINKAAKAAGISFKSMKDQALDAFLSGAQTFSQAKQALMDAGPGVAGKNGAVGEQYKKLLGLGETGGMFSVEALQGLASEAKELGATTIENLFEGLQAQGVSQKEQQALAIALQNAGVNTLEALESIGGEIAVNVLDLMKQSGSEFSKTSQDVRDIAAQIMAIPTSKRVTIELDATITEEMKAILAQFNLLPDGFTGPAATSGDSYAGSAPGVKAPTNKPSKKKVKNTRLSAGVYRDSRGRMTNSAYSYI